MTYPPKWFGYGLWGIEPLSNEKEQYNHQLIYRTIDWIFCVSPIAAIKHSRCNSNGWLLVSQNFSDGEEALSPISLLGFSFSLKPVDFLSSLRVSSSLVVDPFRGTGVTQCHESAKPTQFSTATSDSASLRTDVTSKGTFVSLRGTKYFSLRRMEE